MAATKAYGKVNPSQNPLWKCGYIFLCIGSNHVGTSVLQWRQLNRTARVPPYRIVRSNVGTASALFAVTKRVFSTVHFVDTLPFSNCRN